VAYMTGYQYAPLHGGIGLPGLGDADLLLCAARAGDVNLDGQITAADYAQLDAAYLLHPDAGNTWLDGDSDYDGRITAADYAAIDAAYLASGSAQAAGMMGSHRLMLGVAYQEALGARLAMVPEPGTLALLAGGLAWGLRRRGEHSRQDSRRGN